MSEWTVTTPIDTFEHPETGSVIDIVSMFHVGEPSYYHKLGSYIMGRQDEGFGVHYESITDNDAPNADSGFLDGLKRKLFLAEADAQVDGMVILMLDSSYTTQSNDDLFRDEGARNNDVTEEEIIANTSLFAQLAKFVHARKFRRELKRAARKGTESLDEHTFTKLKKLEDTVKSGNERKSPGHHIIIDRRNEVALAGVDAELVENQDAKLVLVWGLGHLAGLSSGLIERGYTHADTQEVTVAFNRSGLDRSIEKSRVELRRLNEKAGRAQKNPIHTPSHIAPKLPSSRDTLKLLDKESDKRRKALEKSMQESRRRQEEMMKKLERDRKEREKKFGLQPTQKRTRYRRFFQ